MLNVVEQATTAAQQLNWSLVIQCLQNIPLGISDRQSRLEKKATSSKVESVALSDRDLAQVLNLALAVLNAGDFQERWEIAKIIHKLGEKAITPLIEILQDEEADLELRWFAIRILGGFEHPIIITTLLDFLKTSEDAELSAMAAATLSSVGDRAIEALSSLLLVLESRFLATKALAQIRSPQTITPLLSVVNDSDAAVRAMAIEALSSFHDPKIPPILIEALDDLAATVRKEAVIGLGLRADLEQELDLINRLKPLLYDFNEDVCQQAAIALGRLGTAAIEALSEVLQSQVTPLPLKRELIRVLGWMETAASLECLQEALKTSTVETTLEIVRVLGRVSQSNLKAKAAQILLEFNLQQPAVQSNLVKQAVAQSWGELGYVGAVEALVELLAEPAMSVRLHAIAALKNFPASYQQLKQLASNQQLTPALQEGIAIALDEW